MENNELMHYGILGMKWGIRRYQNKDGTLTEEGKLRYGNTNLTTLRDESTIKTLCKMGLVDEDGMVTRKGHRFEVARRSKLSVEETEEELREIVEPCVLDKRTPDPHKYGFDTVEECQKAGLALRDEVNWYICDPYNPEYTPSKTIQKLQEEISDLRDKIFLTNFQNLGSQF